LSSGAHALIVAFGEEPSSPLAEELGLRGPIVTEPLPVWRVGRPVEEVAKALAAAVFEGAALGAALVPEASLPESAWLAFEWRGALVIDPELGYGRDFLAPHWYEKEGEGYDQIRLLRPQPPPCEPRDVQGPEFAGSPREFRSALAGERPVAIEASPEALLADAAEWFGDFADPRLGGAMAIMTLSGARSANQPFLLRNPAALGLTVLEGPSHAARASEAGLVAVRAWGFSWGSLDPAELPTRIPKDQLDQALQAPRTNRAGYGVLLEIDAAVDPEIELEDGTVLEQNGLTGVQTLAAAERRSVTVDAGELRPLVASAWCLNRDLSPPKGEAIRPTPLKLARRYASQGDVWSERDRYTAR
jgi:hypothetical protein